MAVSSETPEELARVFSYYVRTLVDEDDIAKGTAALEVLESLSAIWSHRNENPNLYETVLSTLPLENWREDVIPVPAALIRLLASAWTEYKKDAPGYSLGQKLGVEGRTQGQQSQVFFLQKLRRDIVLARGVFVRRCSSPDGGLSAMSLEAALAETTEEWNANHPDDQVSITTAERAWQKRRELLAARAVAELIIKPPKRS